MTQDTEAERDDLADRVMQFKTMSLPGQPMAMHMGTSYLVNDLWRAVQEARAERDWLRDALWRLVDACEACDWDDAFLDEARAVLTGEAKP